MSRPVKALFFNEGELGVLGHGQLAAMLRTGLAGRADVEASFVGLPPLAPLARRLTWRRPRAGPLDLDLFHVRWHAVHSLHAQRILRAAVREHAPDVLHFHTHSVALASARALRRTPTLLSVDATIRQTRAMDRRALRPHSGAVLAPVVAAERRALRQVATVVAWTRWAAEDVARISPRARVVTLHPGLDLERYRPAARGERARPRVLFVGGNLVEKGGEALLAALGPALAAGEVELDLVTRDPVAPRPGVRVHHLTSADARLLELFQQADLLCLPTRRDAAPWVVLEAMACGTPVVASAVGAIPEQLGDAGLLVPPDAVGELRAALDGLLGDAARRRALAAAARARCEQRYDLRRQTATLVDLMQTVVDERHARATRSGHVATHA